MRQRLQRLLQRKFVQDTLTLQVGKGGMTAIAFVASVITFRLMGAETFGVWGLVESVYSLLQALNLTGIGPSTSTRLAAAVGAQDREAILNNMAFYLRVAAAWALFSTAALALLGPPLARVAYGEARIGVLAAFLSLIVLPDALYNLALIALQSQRQMRTVAILQNLNALTLAVCVIAALLISPTVESFIIGRVIYSIATMGMALLFYRSERLRNQEKFPSIRGILGRVRTVSVRPYWRFGVANALDKNLSGLYLDIPILLVGSLSDPAQAGYIKLVLRGFRLPMTFTSAIFENMQAVVPQLVGRRDFATLRYNFTRVMAVLALGAVGFYGALALGAVWFAPVVVPFIFGEEALPAVPLIPVLCIYGAVTLVGGIFGPLYRALELMRTALLVKLVAFLLVLPSSLIWVQQSQALGGAWMINGLFVISVALTAALTLPVLSQRARAAVSTQN